MARVTGLAAYGLPGRARTVGPKTPVPPPAAPSQRGSTAGFAPPVQIPLVFTFSPVFTLPMWRLVAVGVRTIIRLEAPRARMAIPVHLRLYIPSVRVITLRDQIMYLRSLIPRLQALDALGMDGNAELARAQYEHLVEKLVDKMDE